MAVRAQQDRDFRPVGPDGADRAAHKGADLVSARPLGRSHPRGDKAAFASEDNDRLKAVIVMVGVEQAPFLAAMHAVECVIDVEHDALRHLPERGTVLVDQRPAQAQQRPRLGQRCYGASGEESGTIVAAIKPTEVPHATGQRSEPMPRRSGPG
jgi:hypothetical protein